MELDLWNEDFLLSQEWALEMPDVKIGGHLDDQGSSNRLKGENANDLQFQDASNFEAFNKDDVLGLDWMESTDIGSLLAALGDDQDGTLPLDSSVIDFNSANLLQQVDWIENSPSANDSVQHQPVLGTDSFLSPPESPDHTNSVSSTGSVTDSIPDINVESGSNFLDVEQNYFVTLTGADIYTDLTAVCNGMPENSSVLVGDATGLSFSVPSSPDSSSQASQSSIIESSPELYKVICTSSAANRFTPYPTSTPKQRKKTSSPKSQKRQPAQPVPEYVIMEQFDKKDRKKLQNKNAAIRYRMKKKEEAVDIVGEEKELEDVNMRLKTKVEDLQREIKYMKTLMEDVCKAKGITI